MLLKHSLLGGGFYCSVFMTQLGPGLVSAFGAGTLWNKIPEKVGGKNLKARIHAKTELFAFPLGVVLHVVYLQCCCNEEVCGKPSL